MHTFNTISSAGCGVLSVGLRRRARHRNRGEKCGRECLRRPYSQIHAAPTMHKYSTFHKYPTFHPFSHVVCLTWPLAAACLLGCRSASTSCAGGLRLPESPTMTRMTSRCPTSTSKVRLNHTHDHTHTQVHKTNLSHTNPNPNPTSVFSRGL